MIDSDPVLLDVPETRRQLGGISRTKFYQLLTTGELKGVSIGRKRLVLASSVRGYVERLAGQSEAAR